MNRFSATILPIAELRLIKRQVMQDERGFLSRLFCAEELATFGWGKTIAQVNHTYTRKKGTVRGLHYQDPPHSEIKLVSVLHGEIWDVALDLRQNSPTYLQWHAEVLSAENCNALIIPKGCAHGFQSLTESVEMLYCHSVTHNPSAERGLHPLDPALDIDWPLAISEMSQRDSEHHFIDANYSGISVL